MNEMIERVSRAICKADGVDPDAEGYGLGVRMPKDARYKLWECRVEQAKQAIEAMREPTAHMAAVGTLEVGDGIDADGPPAEVMMYAWQAMIMASLEETQ